MTLLQKIQKHAVYDTFKECRNLIFRTHKLFIANAMLHRQYKTANIINSHTAKKK